MKRKDLPTILAWKIWNNYLENPSDRTLIQLCKTVSYLDGRHGLIERIVQEHYDHVQKIKDQLSDSVSFIVDEAIMTEDKRKGLKANIMPNKFVRVSISKENLHVDSSDNVFNDPALEDAFNYTVKNYNETLENLVKK